MFFVLIYPSFKCVKQTQNKIDVIFQLFTFSIFTALLLLVKGNKVYFVVQKYNAVRSFLRYFESDKLLDDTPEFVEVSKVIDFKPLIKRGTSNRFLFFMHHHVSYQYE